MAAITIELDLLEQLTEEIKGVVSKVENIETKLKQINNNKRRK